MNVQYVVPAKAGIQAPLKPPPPYLPPWGETPGTLSVPGVVLYGGNTNAGKFFSGAHFCPVSGAWI